MLGTKAARGIFHLRIPNKWHVFVSLCLLLTETNAEVLGVQMVSSIRRVKCSTAGEK